MSLWRLGKGEKMDGVDTGTRVHERYAAVLRRVLLCTITILVVTSLPGQKLTPSAQAASNVGYRDFSYAASGVSAPTGQKPQSKLWFNDGSWWGILFNKSAEEYHIYQYNWATHAWSDTGTLVDERNSSSADALWDGASGKLYVASAGPRSSDPTTNNANSGHFLRYSYNATTKRYSLDQGFPVTVSVGGMEAIVLERDSTGRFWVTYTSNRKVRINHSSNATGDKWGVPYILPVTGASNLTYDDISAIISFDSKIGVMWSNQTDGAMYFATHADGAPDDSWQVQSALKGPKYADDHINLKSLQADPSGQVFAAIKTSLNDGTTPDPNAPLTQLLVRDQSGNFSAHVFGTVRDDHTRPIVLIDREHRNLYMFATAPETGGTIYYKETPLSNISFAAGRGTPFIQSSTDPRINNATSTKQDLNSATGLLVMASDDTTGYYLHNSMNLGAASPPPPPADTTAPATPKGLTATPSQSGIALDWNNNTESDLAGYNVYRSDAAGGTFTKLNSTPLASSQYDDTKAPASQYSYYRVTAIDTSGNESAPITDSAERPAPDTAPGIPNGFKATASQSGISLAWKANTETDLAGYNVYRSGAPDGTFVKLNNALLTGTTYNDTKAPAGKVSYYRLTAVDKAGNESGPATDSAYRPAPDTTAPTVTLDSGPEGIIKNRSATFRFHASESGVKFECRLDRGDFARCSSPKSYTSLKDGRHVFFVQATDAAGNRSRLAYRVWIVDTRAPAIGIRSPRPNSTTRDRTPLISAIVRDNRTDLTQADISLFVDQRSTGFSYYRGRDLLRTVKRLPLGRHAIRVVARDDAGNRSVRVWRFSIRR